MRTDTDLKLALPIVPLKKTKRTRHSSIHSRHNIGYSVVVSFKLPWFEIRGDEVAQ